MPVCRSRAFPCPCHAALKRAVCVPAQCAVRVQDHIDGDLYLEKFVMSNKI